MLYGGPLGTYLSGLSTTSSAKLKPSSSFSHSSGSISGSNYPSTSLKRVTSSYRANRLLPSSTHTSPSTTPLSSYYTPQLRRKYGTTEVDSSSKTSRYYPRSSPRISSASTAPSTSASYTGLSHYARSSPGQTGNIGSSSSWTADLNTALEGSIDYKKLYESEKSATDSLREEIQAVDRDVQNLREKIEATQTSRRMSDAERRKTERRIAECDEELKEMEKVKTEANRLRAEHRALVRVVSRLQREL